MKKKILRYLKHLTLTILFLLIVGLGVILMLNGSVNYGDRPAKKNWVKEGPYVFYKNDSLLETFYITGNKESGFTYSKEIHTIQDTIRLSSHFNLDSTSFDFPLDTRVEIPASTYNDGENILAVSDIESGYKTFRDFLISSAVINDKLEWTFGKGHLVLVGDFVDRGNSAMQVLWLIYMLEQAAKKHGGKVHFILGNHEIKNLQGNFMKASMKYFYAAAILGKQQVELYDSLSLIGRWMESKNTIELINGHLFVHGGIHPDVMKYDTNIDAINKIVRHRYRQAYFPTSEKGLEDLLLSTITGPSWYRGYFKDDLTQEELEKSLAFLGAHTVVVGHTIQGKVKKKYKGKVYAIDVPHPKDYRKSWPFRTSEGLLIEEGNYYRVLSNGKKVAL